MLCAFTARHVSDRQDIKAESFRRAAGQYRLIATRLEEKMRAYKIMPAQEKIMDHRLHTEWASVGSLNCLYFNSSTTCFTALTLSFIN